jgi:hypothetical protein
MEVGGVLGEVIAEGGIEAEEAVAGVEVGEGESVGEGEGRLLMSPVWLHCASPF